MENVARHMQTSLVLGAGGFIGSHMANRLKSEGHNVIGCDIRYPAFTTSSCDEFIIGDLTNIDTMRSLLSNKIDNVYQFAADMGGAGYIFTAENDASIMYNSAQINLNLLRVVVDGNFKPRIFYSSSACVYPKENQLNPDSYILSEDSAIPANPDSMYGWEKLFSEQLFITHRRNHGIDVKIGRYHNIYGEEGAWNNGREKAPAAICRKIAEVDTNNKMVEIWGDGKQSRSFLYFDDCIEATLALTNSTLTGPLNIGSEENITINNMAILVAKIANKDITIKNIPGPQGVRGRSSDNKKIISELGWKPEHSLKAGLKITYEWVSSQVSRSASAGQ